DDLLRRVRRDAPEVLGVLLLFTDDGTVVVPHRGEHGDVARLSVELGTCTLGKLTVLRRVLRERGQHRLLDDRGEFIERNLLLALDRTQQGQIDLHSSLPIQLSVGQSLAPTRCRRYPMPQ